MIQSNFTTHPSHSYQIFSHIYDFLLWSWDPDLVTKRNGAQSSFHYEHDAPLCMKNSADIRKQEWGKGTWVVPIALHRTTYYRSHLLHIALRTSRAPKGGALEVKMSKFAATVQISIGRNCHFFLQRTKINCMWLSLRWCQSSARKVSHKVLFFLTPTELYWTQCRQAQATNEAKWQQPKCSWWFQNKSMRNIHW